MKTTHLSTIKSLFPAALCLLLALTGCDDNGDPDVISPGPNARAEVQEALTLAGEGDVIRFDEGTFEFDRTLTMEGKSGVTLMGQGRDKTVFSFAGQTDGGDGLYISNSDNIVVKELGIRDSAGDGLKFHNSHHIVMAELDVWWSGEPDSTNGGYGLYPVLSSDIMIDDCNVSGASDSGIYVGQSDKAVVRNSTAEGNVAGIEIENTTNADVYDNTVRDNAAGILIFDLPGLLQSGSTIRVFDNLVQDNLRGNFAPSGGIVAEVPAGTGIMVLSISEVEIFDNTLDRNNVMGTAVGSYLTLVELGLVSPVQDPEFTPFPEQVYIHDNSYSRSNFYPAADEQSDFGLLLVNSFSQFQIAVPDVILDGIFNPSEGASGSICIEENSGNTFVNLNVADGFPNNLSFDASPHACSMASLPAVTVDVPDY